MNNNTTIPVEVSSYLNAELDVMPIPPNKKCMNILAWPTADIGGMWEHAPAKCNVALRCAGRLGVADLDGDSATSASNIGAALQGLSYPAIVVNTPHEGHRHHWVRMSGAPCDSHSRKLAPSVGAGEFRYGNGAFGLVPDSSVDDGIYEYADKHQTLLDIARLPLIEFKDIASWACPGASFDKADSLAKLPFELVRRCAPASVYRTLEMLHGAAPSEKLDRSGKEFGVLMALVCAGWTFDEARTLFLEFAPAHYAEYKSPRARDKYLVTSWQKAVSLICNDSTRKELAQAISSLPTSWQGRGGGLDASTYKALLTLGWTRNSREFYASVRDIAELSSGSTKGIRNSLARLQAAGVVDKMGKAERGGASKWVIMSMHNKYPDTTVVPLEDGKVHNKYPNTTYREVVGTEKETEDGKVHNTLPYNTVKGYEDGGKEHEDDGQAESVNELWKMLGRASMLVYAVLIPYADNVECAAAKIPQICDSTGKHRNTVAAALEKLSSHGLAEHTAAGWTLGKRSLSEVCVEYDTAALAQRRRDRHDKERAAYARIRAGQARDKNAGNAVSNAVSNADVTARFNDIADAEFERLFMDKLDLSALAQGEW